MFELTHKKILNLTIARHACAEAWSGKRQASNDQALRQAVTFDLSVDTAFPPARTCDDPTTETTPLSKAAVPASSLTTG